MNHTHGNWQTGICNQYEAEGQPCSGWRRLEAEVERLTRERAVQRDLANAEVKWLTRERDNARAEVNRLRAERDTLLLDARDFVRWFFFHFGHADADTIAPLCALNERLQAHADTLAALDAAMTKGDKEGGR